MNRVQQQLVMISKLVLTATATVAVTVALPMIAHADPGTLFFQSPSGNVHCDSLRGADGNAGVECDVENAAYGVRSLLAARRGFLLRLSSSLFRIFQRFDCGFYLGLRRRTRCADEPAKRPAWGALLALRWTNRHRLAGSWTMLPPVGSLSG
jgi:hypothetical protein